jgi:hypothetical protein
VLVWRLPHFGRNAPGIEIAKAELGALPDLLRLTSASSMDGPRR